MVPEFKALKNNKFTWYSKAARPLFSQGSVERMQRFVTLPKGKERGTKCPVTLCSCALAACSVHTVHAHLNMQREGGRQGLQLKETITAHDSLTNDK